MEIGLAGLPGCGKTTVFNALAEQHAEVGGFGAGEIHRATVRVPDERLTRLSAMFSPRKTTPAEVRYLDIAGALGAEARQSAVLGQLRNVDELLHVVRAFESDVHPHPRGSVDPRRDYRETTAELALADLIVVERRVERLQRELRMGKAASSNPQWRELELLESFIPALQEGRAIRTLGLSPADRRILRPYGLLTEKPELIVLNTGDDPSLARGLEGPLQAASGGGPIRVCSLAARLESELAELREDERREFMVDLGIEELGRDRVIALSYQLLDLISFFTVGDDECRAWTIERGSPAVDAAGVIHSDLARGFIRGEVVRYEDLVATGGMTEARRAGVLRVEGKAYPVQDGDIVHFLFNV
ncbi:MAG: redox-regulated ATPase YchF [Chloroflexi bacterium]|nr:redox-regulated ATPase YchF [Chloroflexota bacterium]